MRKKRKSTIDVDRLLRELGKDTRDASNDNGQRNVLKGVVTALLISSVFWVGLVWYILTL